MSGSIASDAAASPLKHSDCMHCGLPLRQEDQDYGFCCGGCQAAYHLIRSEGLDQYYDLRRRLGDDGVTRPVPPGLLEESFVDFDAPRFWQSHVTPLPEGRVQATVRLQGIHCAACVWLLERLPQFQPGVIAARVSLPKLSLELVWDPTKVSLSSIARQLARLGYRAVPMTGFAQDAAQRQQRRRELVQIGVAGACMGNVMLLALAIYAGEWSGMAFEHLQLLRWASAVIGMVSLLGPGATFFRGALAAVRMRTSHMDLPIALGLGVGAASGVWNTLTMQGEIYFDSLTMLVFFLLIGRTLQARQQQAACDAVDLLQQLTPGTAQRVRDGGVEPVAIEDLVEGDILEIRAGATVPVDGVVVQGESEIDRSLITGESLPVLVAEGDEVVAGTLNRSHVLRVRAERVGDQTRLGKLVTKIQEASIHKAPIVQWADSIGAYFVVAVILLALTVGVVTWWNGVHHWQDRVVSLLIVACPCALGLATPLAVAVGLGKSARRGILIKGGDTMQRLVRPGILLLDKTGTVTEGKLVLESWHGPIEALAWTAALEKESQHPIAEAIRAAWSERSQSESLYVANEVRHCLGRGLIGTVEGHAIAIGHREFMHSMGLDLPNEFIEWEQQGLASGRSPLWVAVDGEIRALGGLSDKIRSEAPGVVKRLRQRGWQIGLLSGDHSEVVREVARKLEIDPEWVWGAVTPEAKLEKIKSLEGKGAPVMMVGDGVNDAAALAAADVGIAVRGGAEVSLQVADVFLASGTLLGIEDVMQTARQTMSVIRRNARISLSYNVLAISLAALGWLSPLGAALLMPASSLTVVGVTLAGQRRSNG